MFLPFEELIVIIIISSLLRNISVKIVVQKSTVTYSYGTKTRSDRQSCHSDSNARIRSSILNQSVKTDITEYQVDFGRRTQRVPVSLFCYDWFQMSDHTFQTNYINETVCVSLAHTVIGGYLLKTWCRLSLSLSLSSHTVVSLAFPPIIN